MCLAIASLELISENTHMSEVIYKLQMLILAAQSLIFEGKLENLAILAFAT